MVCTPNALEVGFPKILLTPRDPVFRVYMQPSAEVFVCSALVTDLMLISVSDVHDRSLFQYQ